MAVLLEGEKLELEIQLEETSELLDAARANTQVARAEANLQGNTLRSEINHLKQDNADKTAQVAQLQQQLRLVAVDVAETEMDVTREFGQEMEKLLPELMVCASLLNPMTHVSAVDSTPVVPVACKLCLLLMRQQASSV